MQCGRPHERLADSVGQSEGPTCAVLQTSSVLRGENSIGLGVVPGVVTGETVGAGARQCCRKALMEARVPASGAAVATSSARHGGRCSRGTAKAKAYLVAIFPRAASGFTATGLPPPTDIQVVKLTTGKECQQETLTRLIDAFTGCPEVTAGGGDAARGLQGADLLHRPFTDAPQLPGYAFYGSLVSAMSSSIVRLSASERPMLASDFQGFEGIRGEAHGRLAVHRPVREQQRA